MRQIDMSKGNPIDFIQESILKELNKQIMIPTNHRYPLNESEGYTELRKEISNWYYRRYNVKIDPTNEAAVLLGSKEGILYFLLSFISKGDCVVITNPSYPTYKYLINYVGAIPFELKINTENNFLPDLESIPKSILTKTKAIIINYPNNPTCAVASKGFFTELVQFAVNNNIKVVNDNPYIEFVTNQENRMSILESEGAKNVCIELNSFSKIFNMAGWRLGMVVGNEEIISKMIQLKKMVDAGAFLALQKASIIALNKDNDVNVDNLVKKFAIHKKNATEELIRLGWNYNFQEGTYYIWLPCREIISSVEYCEFLKEQANILVTPGLKYGSNGEGYVRMSLAISEEDLQEVLFRLQRIYN
jgi:LL-diaminopimelate aminotransferase